MIVNRPTESKKHSFVSEIQDLILTISRSCEIIKMGDTNLDVMDRTVGAINQYINNTCEIGLECTTHDFTQGKVYKGTMTRTYINHYGLKPIVGYILCVSV